MPEATIGRSLPRLDGLAKVTGRALYTDDHAPAGCLHGATVRSAIPHGILQGITKDPSFDWSDVVFVTAADIPAAGKNVVALIQDDQPALVPVGGRIRHWDEAVALVAAPTRRKAQEAAQHVTLEVEQLRPLLDMEASLRGEVVLHGSDNLFSKIELLHGLPAGGGDIEAALAGCDLVVEGEYHTGAQEQMYIEPQGMIAWWEGDVACALGSLQCPYYVHKGLKALLGAKDEDVRVTQAVTGGGFGGKEEYPTMIAAHAVLLAKKAGRPVKIVYDRTEDVRATTKRHPSRVKHRMGFRKDGTLVAIDVDILMDGGAYCTLSPVVLSRGVLHASGPYRVEHARIIGRSVATNHPPHGAFRGFGAPQTTFAYERQMQKAARQLGIDPWALRRKNMLRLEDTTVTGQTLRWSVGSAEVLDAAEQQLAKPAPVGAARAPGAAESLRRGRGMAFFFHGAGFTGSGEERLKGKASVAVAADGVLEIRSGSTDIGQGTLTTFVQIASDELGVPPEAIRFREPTTGHDPDSGPTVASRTCMIVGRVVAEASRKLRAGLEAWAKEKKVAGDLVAVAREHAKAAGERVETVTYQMPPGIRWDDAKYQGDAYPVFGWAVVVVDVAVDLDTYEVTIERCVHACDVGKAIHPRIVQGQIEGGTLQALGWALWESVSYSNGRVANPRMTNCIIPTSMEAPEMETILVEVPYPHGPQGAKGVGEIPMDGPAVAVAAALEDALGVPFDELPILPETIERALRGDGCASSSS